MRTVPALLTAAMALALALSACMQTTRWEKPQTGADAVAADLADCRLQAASEAQRMAGPFSFGFSSFGYRSPYHRSWRMGHDARLRHDQMLFENRLTAFCMRTKGYERVVVDDDAA